MTGWNEAFPYIVADDSWLSYVDVQWQDMCKWCDTNLPGEWEYFNGEYRFATERAKMLFLLRWSNGQLSY